MRTTEKIDKLAPAMVNALAEMPRIAKDTKGGGGRFSYKYATLDTILEKVKPVLKKHGLALVQGFGDTVAMSGTKVGLFETMIVHESGQYLVSSMPFDRMDPDSQKFGSWMSYVRRYCLNAILGIFPEIDDDGLLSSPSGQEKKKQGMYDEENHDVTNTGLTSGQVEEISALHKELDMTPEQENSLLQWIDDKYGTTNFLELTMGQGDNLIRVLKKKLGEKQ